MNVVGFYILGVFDKVFVIEKCWLQDDIFNCICNMICDYVYEYNYFFINFCLQEGMFCNMIVCILSIGELMVILICKIMEEYEMDFFKQLL